MDDRLVVSKRILHRNDYPIIQTFVTESSCGKMKTHEYDNTKTINYRHSKLGF